MGKRADVGAHGEGHAGGELLFEFLRVEIEELAIARALRGRGGVVGEIFEDGESGHGEDLFFAHQAHGFVAELKSVVDGFDAGARGVERAGLAHGVYCDAIAGARGFAHGGGEFFFGVLIRSGEAAVGDLVRAGFVNFDEVGAFLQFGANGGDEFGGVVGVVAFPRTCCSGL